MMMRKGMSRVIPRGRARAVMTVLRARVPMARALTRGRARATTAGVSTRVFLARGRVRAGALMDHQRMCTEEAQFLTVTVLVGCFQKFDFCLLCNGLLSRPIIPSKGPGNGRYPRNLLTVLSIAKPPHDSKIHHVLESNPIIQDFFCNRNCEMFDKFNHL